MRGLRGRNIKNDLKRIEKFSNLAEQKLSIFDKDKKRIEQLSFEELQDLNQILQMADYILTKYEDKKEVYGLLKEFVEMITASSTSMDLLNDKISEHVVSAEDTVSKIKNLQNDVSENYSLKCQKTQLLNTS
jgi:hypothetical protein